MEPGRTWADAILAELASGIDTSQIDERLRLSPEQRLARMQAFLRFLDGFQPTPAPAPADHALRPPSAD